MYARTPPTPPLAAGFTLVELLIVVVLLGIFSLVALPSATSQRAEAVKSSLKASVQAVNMQVEYRRQQTPDGKFQPTIEESWFLSGSLPSHPDNMAGVPSLETVAMPGLTHPRSKVLTSGAAGAYWYNSTTGTFRARVKSLESAEETLSFYNEVNGCHASSLLASDDSAAPAAAAAPETPPPAAAPAGRPSSPAALGGSR